MGELDERSNQFLAPSFDFTGVLVSFGGRESYLSLFFSLWAEHTQGREGKEEERILQNNPFIGQISIKTLVTFYESL